MLICFPKKCSWSSSLHTFFSAWWLHKFQKYFKALNPQNYAKIYARALIKFSIFIVYYLKSTCLFSWIVEDNVHWFTLSEYFHCMWVILCTKFIAPVYYPLCFSNWNILVYLCQYHNTMADDLTSCFNRGGEGAFQNTYELLNPRALKISMLY